VGIIQKGLLPVFYEPWLMNETGQALVPQLSMAFYTPGILAFQLMGDASFMVSIPTLVVC